MASQPEIKTAIERARRVYEARPEEGRVTKAMTVTLEDGILCRCEEGGQSVEVDMPPVFGGEDAAPNPGFYARAALGACNTITFAYALATRGIPFSRLQMRVESDMELGGGLGVPGARTGHPRTRLFVTIESPAEPAEIEEALAEAEARSTVRSIFRDGTELSRELKVVQPAATE